MKDASFSRATYHNPAIQSWLRRPDKSTAQLHHNYSGAQNQIWDLEPTVSSISLQGPASPYNMKLGKNVSEEYKWSLWTAAWRNWHKFSPHWTRFLVYIVLFLFYIHWFFSSLYI